LEFAIVVEVKQTQHWLQAGKRSQEYSFEVRVQTKGPWPKWVGHGDLPRVGADVTNANVGVVHVQSTYICDSQLEMIDTPPSVGLGNNVKPRAPKLAKNPLQ
jgi:hypothetical protein